MIAFHGDPAVKAAVLADIDAKAPIAPLAPGGAGEPQLVAWADDVGLAAALVLLADRLNPSLGVEIEPQSVAFVRELVSEIVPAAETAGVAHGWMAWVWDGAPEPLSSLLWSPEGQAAGASATVLHRRAAEGEPIDRGDWRAARRRLNLLAQADDEAGRAAAVLAAGAWDFVSVPGAITDAVGVWEDLYRVRIERSDGWGPSEAARLEALLDKVRPLLRERVGANPGRGDPQALTAYLERFRSEFTALIEQHNDPIWDRSVALRQKISETLSRQRQDGRDALIRLLGETSQPDRLGGQ